SRVGPGDSLRCWTVRRQDSRRPATSDTDGSKNRRGPPRSSSSLGCRPAVRIAASRRRSPQAGPARLWSTACVVAAVAPLRSSIRASIGLVPIPSPSAVGHPSVSYTPLVGSCLSSFHSFQDLVIPERRLTVATHVRRYRYCSATSYDLIVHVHLG